MTALRELPIAPRPDEDELLSSWQGRVACRYDLRHDNLSRWFGVLGDDRRLRFAERDFAPSAEMVQAWAAACRLSEDRVGNLALSSCPRSLSWYVWGEGRASGAFQRPVCLACLDDDAAAGRDHHFRRSWALVETIVCNRHHRILEETCPHCLAWSGFRFVILGATARLVCAECSRIIGGAGPRRRDGSETLFAAMSALIASAISDQTGVQDRMMYVARLLWKLPCARTGRRTPFVADVLPDLRLPPSVAMATDRADPLATAPIGWRMITLLGVVTLLKLDGPWKGLGVSRFTIDQMLAWVEEERPPPREKQGLTSSAAASRNWPRIRSDAEYLRLAESILGSKDWHAALKHDHRTQRRVLSRLVDKALLPSSRAGLA